MPTLLWRKCLSEKRSRVVKEGESRRLRGCHVIDRKFKEAYKLTKRLSGILLFHNVKYIELSGMVEA